ERQAPAWDAAYVAPAEPAEAAHEAAEAPAPAPGPYAAAAAAAVAAEQTAQAIAAAAPITTLRASLLSWTADGPSIVAGVPGAAGGWPGAAEGVPGAVPGAAEGAPWTAAFAAGTPAPLSTARTMLESMSLPMLGDGSRADDRGGAWTAPGMIASRAHSWS